MKNLEQYKDDLKKLLKSGEVLRLVMQWEYMPEEEERGDDVRSALKALPSFSEGYQAWYSEAKALVRQLLPDRLEDFSDYYETRKPRREITAENYKISDYVLGLAVTAGSGRNIVGPDAAIPKFRQQLENASKARSSI